MRSDLVTTVISRHKSKSLLLTITIVFLFVGCQTKPILFEFSPESYTDGSIHVTPWFGAQGHLVRIENRSDDTIYVDPGTMVLVTTNGYAKSVNPSFGSTILPPRSHTLAELNVWTIGTVDPEVLIWVQSNPNNSLAFTDQRAAGYQTDEQRRAALAQLMGSTIRLRFAYSINDELRELDINFRVDGARIMEHPSFR